MEGKYVGKNLFQIQIYSNPFFYHLILTHCFTEAEMAKNRIEELKA